MNASVIAEKFEDFISDRTCDRRFVSVKGKTPVRPGTDQPVEWRKAENRFTWDAIQKIPGDVGVILDKTGLSCIDFDKCLDESGRVSDGIQDVLDRLDTFTEISTSGRGLHCWVITDANTPNRKPGNGVELITDGHVKITGNPYPPCASKPIKMINGEDLLKILQLDGNPAAQVKAPFKLPDEIPAGQRNITMLRLASSLRVKGASDVEVVAALRVLNGRCSPPLDDQELIQIASKYPSPMKEGGKYPDRLEPVLKIDFKKLKQPHQKIDTYAVSQQIMARYNYITLKDTSEILVYIDGIYHPYGDVHVKLECQKILGEDASIHDINEIIGHIQRETYIDRDVLGGKLNLIAVENGVLNIHTGELVNHHPSFFFTSKLPVKYDKDAKCPECEKFFKDIVPAEDIQAIEEWFGYCLYREYPVQKALMVLGEGYNGKSTLLKLLTRMLGKNNTSSELLQTLEEDKFATARLFGKLANISADIPSTDMKTSSFFKMLVGGDRVPAQEKFARGFYFINYAKLIFSANRLPRTNDDSLAYFRRWCIIVFPNSFEGKDNKTLIDTLSTDAELSGLLNVSLAGLNRLIKNGNFTNAKSAEDMQDRYQRLSDSVYAFVMDCLEVTSTGDVIKKLLYDKFTAYCREKRLPVVSDKTFHSRLPRYCQVEDVRPQIGDKREHCWRGIRIKGDSI